MYREKVLEGILRLRNKNILAELPTSFGKSRIALELLKHRKAKKVLIAVPRNVLKDNWKAEINKWGVDDADIQFTTYVSLPKCTGKWDMVIFDECHHLSERCREALCNFNIKSSILLSATVSNNLKDEFNEVFEDLYCFKIKVATAIKEEVLPNPRVILLPLTLNNSAVNMTIEFNKGKSKNCSVIPYKDIWTARKNKNKWYKVTCTERQYYNEMSSKIEWLKNRRGMLRFKNMWLHKCGERLKWLSLRKTSAVKDILQHLNLHRTLTFCCSIEQTEVLGKYCINSQNKYSVRNLNNFNTGNIHHITAVNMLNEGRQTCPLSI